MATSSFQSITIADYLRILFQRLWVIVLCTSISVLVASYFAFFSMKKRFKSSMDIQVYQKHSRNPYLRHMLPKASLTAVITDLRDRLQGEKRLSLLAFNLRLFTKNFYINAFAREKYRENQLEAMQKIISSISTKERQRFISRLEIVTIAKIFGAITDAEIDPFKMRNNASGDGNSEYLIDGGNETFIKKLREIMSKFTRRTSKGNVLTLDELRRAALNQLDLRLKDPRALAKFSNKQLWELRKEYLGKDWLRLIGLYNITLSSGLQRMWVDQLKISLSVSITRNNFINLSFDSASPSLRQAIPHLVVQCAYEMIKAEYYASEEGYRIEAKQELQKQIRRLSEEIVEINKRLAKHEDLIKIQIAYATDSSSTNLTEKINKNDFQLPRVSTHIQNLNKLSEEKIKFETDIEEREARVKELEKILADPSKVRIIQRTIRREDSPVTRELQTKKRQKEEQLRTMRIDATEKHPMVKKLINEIHNIELALAGRDQPIETTIEKEHPLVPKWRDQREEHIREIAGLKVRLKKIEQRIKDEMQKAIDAPKRLQQYETLQRRRANLKQVMGTTQDQLEQLLSKENVGKGIRLTEFEIYHSPVAPTMHYAPRIEVIIGIGFLIGVVTSLSAIFFIEYTDHSIKGLEDIKRHFEIPILGTIPEFEFQEVESGHIQRWLFFNRIFKGDAAEQDTSRRRSRDVVIIRKYSPLRMLVIVLLITIMVVATIYGFKGISRGENWGSLKVKVKAMLGLDKTEPVKPVAKKSGKNAKVTINKILKRQKK